ncbi:hypothetical protein BKA80DRAFT_137755 [Phyllosticta citrichinensis]
MVLPSCRVFVIEFDDVCAFAIPPRRTHIPGRVSTSLPFATLRSRSRAQKYHESHVICQREARLCTLLGCFMQLMEGAKQCPLIVQGNRQRCARQSPRRESSWLVANHSICNSTHIGWHGRRDQGSSAPKS